MKKIVATSVISLMVCTQVFCQKGGYSVGLGPSLGFPVFNNNFSYYYKNGIGGSVQANFAVSKLGSITTNVLLISIGAKNLPVTNKSSLTLIKAGYKTNFLNSGFFVGIDAGLARYGSGNSNFVIGGTVGYTFTVSKRSYIDLFPSYNRILGTGNNNMWLTANVLYRFNLKRKNKQ